jgi:hypothetical protein
LQRSLIDKKRGRPHSVRSNADICRALQVPGAREWWAGTLAFDALIGNTDRHPDNWGILARVVPCDHGSLRSLHSALRQPATDDAFHALRSHLGGESGMSTPLKLLEN